MPIAPSSVPAHASAPATWPAASADSDSPQAAPSQSAAPSWDETPSQTLSDMARAPGMAAAHSAAAHSAASPSAAPQTSSLNLSADGLVQHPNVQIQIHPERHIERGSMPQVNGIVIHQTGAPTAASTFNSYATARANGAHFLIDKDGTIYQTASLHKATNHVGFLRSRCEDEESCQKSNSGVKDMHNREKVKSPGDRYPSNQDAVGIELVGGYHAAKTLTESLNAQGQRVVTMETDKGQTIVYENVGDEALTAMKYEYEKTKDRFIYEPVTPEQNASLQWLTQQLKAEFQVSDSEVFAHPVISRKNQTEASTARPQ